jgi:predicted hotdog family 3-hydroxylacyl-ACP dehydratase
MNELWFLSDHRERETQKLMFTMVIMPWLELRTRGMGVHRRALNQDGERAVREGFLEETISEQQFKGAVAIGQKMRGRRERRGAQQKETHLER